jgi:glucose/mannose-6-phosphate isomerase
MKEFIEKINEQIVEAVDIANTSNFKKYSKISEVLICGVGGSGISGTIVANIFKDECKVPIFVNKSYNIPKWVNKNTLTIISSYSGTTEETVSCLNQALKANTQILCIATGGTVIEEAKDKNLDYIIIPSGYQPRAALIYSLIQIINVLSSQGFISDKTNEIKNASEILKSESCDAVEYARHIAKFMVGSIPIIYSDDIYEGIAIRFRQQLNENAKMIAFSSTLPEMNHNELVALFGQSSNSKNYRCIFINTGHDHVEMRKRYDFLKITLDKRGIQWLDIITQGNTPLEKALYTIHLADWISYYLSIENDVDPFDVGIIGALKDFIKRD